jgi:hypothetical protein
MAFDAIATWRDSWLCPLCTFILSPLGPIRDSVPRQRSEVERS